MLEFMFGVLGSLVFWAIYVVVSFFATIMLAKSEFYEGVDRDDLCVLATGKRRDGSECSYKGMAMFSFVMTFFLWHVILVFYVIFKLIGMIFGIFGKIMSLLILKTMDKVPGIRVSIKKR